MKKTILLSAFVFALALASQAQDLDLKAGLTFPATSEKLGLNVGAKYGITPEIDAEAALSLFAPTKVGDSKFNIWMLDLNGHYNFEVQDGFIAYPLAGLNFTGATSKVGDTRAGNTELGLNIGGGAMYQISDPLKVFLDLRYVLGNADQAIIGFGVYYALN